MSNLNKLSTRKNSNKIKKDKISREISQLYDYLDELKGCK